MPVVIAEAEKLGYHIDEMSIGGGSAGHCLAMLYAYRDAELSPVPVRMVFGTVGPSSFYPEDWGCYGLDKNTDESGGDVTESKKGFFCETNDCRFGLWRDNKFLTSKKIQLSKKTAATLLKNGRIPVKGIFSEKTGKSYYATFVMTDDGAKTFYSLNFGK